MFFTQWESFDYIWGQNNSNISQWLRCNLRVTHLIVAAHNTAQDKALVVVCPESELRLSEIAK